MTLTDKSKVESCDRATLPSLNLLGPCDERHAYRHDQQYGAPEPELPPFDPSKFDPMPEVEINPDDEFGGP